MNSNIGYQSQRLLWTFGHAEFDEAAYQLRVCGEPVRMEPRALEILRCLLMHGGATVTKGELLRAVWGHPHLTANVLSNGIGKLRKALHDEDQKIIVTNYKVGYQLAEPVSCSIVPMALDPDPARAGQDGSAGA